MANCAVIDKNDFVVNTVFFNDASDIPNFDFPSLYGEGSFGIFTEDDFPVAIGWTYSDGEFHPPVPPEPTHGELVYQAEMQRQLLLKNANDVFVSWQTKLLLNRATEDEKKSLNEWLDYFEALQQINTDTAPDITWPEQPPIPEGGQ